MATGFLYWNEASFLDINDVNNDSLEEGLSIFIMLPAGFKRKQSKMQNSM